MDPGIPLSPESLGGIMHVNMYLLSDWKEMYASLLQMSHGRVP